MNRRPEGRDFKKLLKPAANREAVHHIQAAHGYSERRVCRVIPFNRCSARRPPSENRDLLLRTRMLELANDRRRFGSPSLHEFLRREELVTAPWCFRHRTSSIGMNYGVRFFQPISINCSPLGTTNLQVVYAVG